MSVYYPTAVRSITDGEQVNAAETAKAVLDLTARTDWLKDTVTAISLGKQLRLTAQTVTENLTPGTIVYFNSSINKFEPAIGLVTASDHIQLSSSSFWQGIIESVTGVTATIIISGSLTLLMSNWNSVWDGVAIAGDVYLSEQVPGHLTSSKGNFGIYVGNLNPTGELLIRAGGMNGYTQHIHLKRQLLASPAGVVVDPAFGVAHAIATPSAAIQGWLPATNIYFPGFTVGVQIPVGCAFGYNLQHPDASGIRQIFPIIPPNTAMITQAGVVVDAAKYIINQYGIWWMDATYGNAPWPIDYNNSGGVTIDFDLYVTKIMASSELLDLVVNQVIAQLTGGINQVSVAKLKTTNQNTLQISATAGDNTNGYYGTVTLAQKGVTGVFNSASLGFISTNRLGNLARGSITGVGSTLGYELTHLMTYVPPAEGTELWKPLGTNVSGLYGHRVSAGGWVDFALKLDAGFIASSYYPLSFNFLVTFAVNYPTFAWSACTRVGIYCVQDSTDIYTQPQGLLYEGRLWGTLSQDIIQQAYIHAVTATSGYIPVGSTLIIRIYGHDLTYASWSRFPGDVLRIVSVNAEINQPMLPPTWD